MSSSWQVQFATSSPATLMHAQWRPKNVTSLLCVTMLHCEMMNITFILLHMSLPISVTSLLLEKQDALNNVPLMTESIVKENQLKKGR